MQRFRLYTAVAAPEEQWQEAAPLDGSSHSKEPLYAMGSCYCAAIYLGAAFSLIVWLKRVKKQEHMLEVEKQSAPTIAPTKEVIP